MRGHRFSVEFPALELILSLAGHLLIGGGIVVFEDLWSAGIEIVEEEEAEVQYVKVTQVKLAKESNQLPDKASQRPREDTPSSENPPTPSESRPEKPRTPSQQSAPTTETSHEPSFDDIMDQLPTASDAPESSEDRDATDSEGSDRPVLGLSDVGPNTPVGRWMTECGEVIRRGIFVGDHILTEIEDPNAYVVYRVDIADDGTVSDPEKDPIHSSGSDFFDRKIRSGLKMSPRCPPRPVEAAEFSNSTRIRVPVRKSD